MLKITFDKKSFIFNMYIYFSFLFFMMFEKKNFKNLLKFKFKKIKK